MHASEFSDRSPGRLVPVGEGRVAFVPDPLPSDVPLDRRTSRLLANAEFVLGRLAGTTATLVDPRLVTSSLVRREAMLSSRIDGTVTTPERLVMFEAGIPDGEAQQLDDTRAVLNYVRVIEHGLRSTLPICVRLISELHAVLLGDTRITRAHAMPRSPGDLPPEPSGEPRVVRLPIQDMQACLDVFERRLQRTTDALPVLVELALVHYQFEAIHPFRDGNGRIGRALLPLALARHGRLSQPVLCLSAYLEQHRAEYFNALRAISQQSAWVPWVAFFLRGVEQSAEEGLERVDGLLALRRRYLDLFQGTRSSRILAQMLDELFMLPCTTVARMAELLPLKRAAVAVGLQRLVKAGILVEVSGRKRDCIFLAPAILGFMRGRDESE